MNIRLLMVSLFLITIAFSCAQKNSGSITFSPHYPDSPTVLKLKSQLEEISGLSYNTSDNSVYAISDDKGSLYKISLSDGRIVSSLKFHRQKNFEDLAIIGDTCYVLNSNGDIISFNYKTNEVKDAIIHQFPE